MLHIERPAGRPEPGMDAIQARDLASYGIVMPPGTTKREASHLLLALFKKNHPDFDTQPSEKGPYDDLESPA
jgi:hypothetical protein